MNKQSLVSAGKKMIQPAIALLAAFVVTSVIILVIGYSPFNIFGSILKGAFGNANAVLGTMFRMTPILMTGLAFTVAIRAGLVNIGIEGQLCTGAFIATLVGLYARGLAPLPHILLTIGGAVLGGGLCGAFIAFMKIRFNAHEFITSIMMNSIVTYITSYFVSGPLRTPGDVAQTSSVSQDIMLPMLSERNNLSIGIIIAVALAVILFFYFKCTTKGFEMNIVGNSPMVARFSGIHINKTIYHTMFLSGGIAGLCGAVHVLGYLGRYINDFSPGFGFDGIAVSALAGGNPLACIASSLLFGGLKAGSIRLNIMTKAPKEFVDLIQAVAIILIAAPKLTSSLESWMCKKANHTKQAQQQPPAAQR